MTTDERLDRLTGIVETRAGSVASHDSTIDSLTGAVTAYKSVIDALAGAASAHSAAIEAHDRQIAALLTLADQNQTAMTQLQREWQAYLNTLRRQ